MYNDADWAVIVGLDKYIGLPISLDGPEADARDFYEWVTTPAPSGGGVPLKNVQLVVSSEYPGPFTDPMDAAYRRAR